VRRVSLLLGQTQRHLLSINGNPHQGPGNGKMGRKSLLE